MKRVSGQELTKEVLQTPNKKEEEVIDTPEQIAQRRILKLKGNKNEEKPQEQNQNQQSQSGLKLTTPLVSNQNEQNQKDEDKDSKKNENNENVQKPLFTGGLFGNTSSNIFGQPVSGGLFSNLQGVKPLDKPISGGGLFGNTQQPSLFGNQAGGLFGTLPEGWLKSGPSNLENDEDDDDAEGGNDPLEDKSEGNPEESKANFEYQQDFDKIINISINKFRSNQQDPALQGFISIEKLKENFDQYIIVYRNSTKLIQYQGIILKRSQFSKLNNRDDCLQMSSYQFVEEKKEVDDKQTKKLKTDILKIMFKSKEDCEKFIASLQSIIDQLNKLGEK